MRRVNRILKIGRKWPLRMAVKLKKLKRATTTLKTTVRKQEVIAMKRPPPFTLKIPVNIVRILMCTGHWSWNVLIALGTIHFTRSSRTEITWKRAFFGAMIVEQWHTKRRRRWKPLFIPALNSPESSRISPNLRTGPTGHATVFNQWEGALVYINKQIKTSPQWSEIFKTADGVGQNQSSFRGSQAYF